MAEAPTEGQTPYPPPISRATRLTITNTRPPQPAETITLVLDWATGSVDTKVVSPQGVILYAGSPEQVINQLSGTDQERSDQIIRAIKRDGDALREAYKKFTLSKTAKDATNNAPPPPEPQPVTEEEKDKIEKGNQPPVAPATPESTPPAQQPTLGNNEDRASTAQENRSNPSANSNQTPRSGTIEGNNPLENYASYTYNFILASLDPKEEYNKMVSDPTYRYKLKNILIASGAKKDSVNYPRDPRFLAEFFIEDVKFDTIIGLNARNKSSNALTVSFTIKEPYGVTFFDRLYELSLSKPNYRNYIELPYLLVIEFVGYTDDGKPVKLTNQTKYIPIKIVASTLTVTGAGSEYRCEAVPFNQMSQMATEHGSTPINVQVTAGKVAEFFADVAGDAITQQYDNDRRETRDRVNIINQTVDLEGNFEEDRRKEIQKIDGDFRKKYYNAKSYPQALDAFQKLVVNDKKALRKNVYRFEIDPKIAESVLYTPVKTPSNRQQFNNDVRTGANDGNKETGQGAIFNINGGTSIIDVINMVMRNSDYIRSQITDNESAARENSANGDAQKIANAAKKPINWFKITSVVKLLDYDEQRNTFAKEIIFYIDPYTVFNTRSPLVPKAFPNNWVQEYNYIFTGDNRSILDLDLRFDTLFAVLTSVNPNKWKAMNFGPAAAGDVEVDYNTSTAKSFMPTKFVPQAGYMPDQVGNIASETAANIKVSDLYNTVLSSSAADMIQVDLTIVGDPRYIKQDDVLYNSSNQPDIKSRISTQNNSFVFDYEERYVRLNFKSPTDYDPTTGLLSKSNYTVSRFSGLYRIIRVENNFSRGRFTQVLQLVRLANQPDDYPQEEKKDSNARPPSIPDIWGGVDPFSGALPTITDQRSAEDRSRNPGKTLAEYQAELDKITAERMAEPTAEELFPIGVPKGILDPTFSVVQDVDQGDGTYALWDNKTGTYSQRGYTKEEAERVAKSFNTAAVEELNKPISNSEFDRLTALRLSQQTGEDPGVIAKRLAARRKEAIQAELDFQARQTGPSREDYF
jgi:hypothetical protein